LGEGTCFSKIAGGMGLMDPEILNKPWEPNCGGTSCEGGQELYKQIWD